MVVRDGDEWEDDDTNEAVDETGGVRWREVWVALRDAKNWVTAVSISLVE